MEYKLKSSKSGDWITEYAKFTRYRSADPEEHIYIFDSNIWTDEPVQAFIDTCKANGGYCNIVKIKYIEE